MHTAAKTHYFLSLSSSHCTVCPVQVLQVQQQEKMWKQVHTRIAQCEVEVSKAAQSLCAARCASLQFSLPSRCSSLLPSNQPLTRAPAERQEATELENLNKALKSSERRLVLICLGTLACNLKSAPSCPARARLLAAGFWNVWSLFCGTLSFFCLQTHQQPLLGWMLAAGQLAAGQLAAGQLAGQARQRQWPGGCRRACCWQRHGATPQRQRGAGWRLGWQVHTKDSCEVEASKAAQSCVPLGVPACSFLCLAGAVPSCPQISH